MGWSHCEVADIADTVACPACGVSKAAWTLKVDATRTFTVARRTKKREKTAWVEVELEGAAGAQVEVETPDGQLLARTLDGAGLVRFDALYPEPVRVRFPDRARARCEGAELDADGWTTCAPERRYRFTSGAEPVGVSIVWPRADPQEGTHRQWVNLSPRPGEPERGSLLQVRLAARAGQRLHLRATRAPGHSLRDDPRPATVGGVSLEEPLELVVPASGEVLVDVELGLAGGDVLELRAGTSAACSDAKVSVTNWRKIWYQVTRTEFHGDLDLSAMHAAYEHVFIRLERTPDVVLSPDDGRMPPGSWLEAAELETGQHLRPGKRLVVGRHNQRVFPSLFQRTAAPLAHFVIADRVIDGISQAGDPFTDEVPTFTLTGPDEGHSIASSVSMRIYSVGLHDGAPSLVHGRWRSLAPEGHPDHGRSGEVRQGDLRIRFGLKVVVTLRDHAEPGRELIAGVGGPGAAHQPVEVELRFHAAMGASTEGRSVGDAQTLITFDPSARHMAATCGHELGHALGQAGKRIAPGLDKATHGRYFVANDFGGPHCGDGLSDAEFSRAHFKPLRGTCLLWGALDGEPNDQRLRYCARCEPFVKAEACQELL